MKEQHINRGEMYEEFYQRPCPDHEPKLDRPSLLTLIQATYQRLNITPVEYQKIQKRITDRENIYEIGDVWSTLVDDIHKAKLAKRKPESEMSILESSDNGW